MKLGIIQQHGVRGHLSRVRGASLLEGIAYLGIAAIVILGAVSLLTNAFGNAQANRATEEVISLRTSVRKLFIGQVYPAAINAVLISAAAVPASLTTTAPAAITNSWGGAVTVVGNAGAGGVNSFTITYNAVPQAVCINMLSGATGWTAANGSGVAAPSFPVTAGDAAAACTAGNNIVTLTAT